MEIVPKEAGELEKEIVLFKKSLMALSDLTNSLSLTIATGTRMTGKKSHPKKLYQMLRGGWFTRPWVWIRDIHRCSAEISENIKKLKYPGKKSPWHNAKVKKIDDLYAYYHNEARNIGVYVNSIITALPARGFGTVGEGKFAKFLKNADPEKLSVKEMEQFGEEVNLVKGRIISLISIAGELEKKVRLL